MSQPSSPHASPHARPYSLAAYGWDEACEHAFLPHRAAGLIPARVVRAERGSCEAATDTGIARTGIPGTDDPHASPCTGDWVALRPAFAEIEHLAQDCRFTDCAHEYEPGCAVLAAVETGEIGQRRLDSYHKLLRENAYAASRTDARLRADRGAVKKDITRHLRATYQFRERQR